MTILGGSKTSEHQIIKLDQNGVTKVKSQNFGPLFAIILQLVELQKFSPDGQKWVYYCPLMDYGSLTLIGRKRIFNYKFHNIRHKLHSATGLEWSLITDSFTSVPVIPCFNTIPGWKTWSLLKKLVDIWDGSNDPFKTVFAKCSWDPIAEFSWAVLAAQNPSMSSTTRMKPLLLILYNTISSYSHHWHKEHAYLSQLQTGFRAGVRSYHYYFFQRYRWCSYIKC